MDAIEHLAQKVKEENAENENQRILSLFGRQPTQNPHDGSYIEVKSFLQNHANDPDSIKIVGWSKLAVDESVGYVVSCAYRGKNAFGALVKNSNWFVIRHGRVTKSLPSDAY